jgi:crotonobetainyl-CoA:carnitine CoA-transferase CaiB-like acyl-CoA transferase
MALAFGVATALLRKARTGRGSIVDVSLLATAMWTLASDVISALQGNFASGMPPGGTRRLDAPNPVVSNYETKDERFISLVFLQPDRYWARFCEVIGQPELAGDPRFADAAARRQNRRECATLLAETFQSRTFVEWCELFADESFPWAPFQRVPELVEDRQVAANGYLGEVAVEGGPSFRLPTGAVQFDEMPATLSRAPEHGEDTEAVLLDLGLSWEEVAAHKATGAIL